MASLLCQGRSVSPSKPPENGGVLQLVANTATMNSGLTRNNARYKQRTDNEGPVVTTSPMELQGRMSAPNARKSYQQYQSKRCGSYIDVTEGTHKLCKTRPKTSLGARHAGDLPFVDVDGQKPKIFLESSPSGNNINFTCKIDKRLLRSPTSMAIHIDDYGQPKLDITKAPELAAKVECPPVEVAPADTGFHDGVASSGGGGITTTEISSKKLSKENMHAFEQSNVLTSAQKKKNVEKWVDEVNTARQMKPLLQSAHKLLTMRSDRTGASTLSSQPLAQPLTAKRETRYAKRSPTRASSPFGLAGKKLGHGTNSGKNSPSREQTDGLVDKRPTTALGIFPKHKKDGDLLGEEKTKKQKRKMEMNKLPRGRQDVEGSFSKEMYDAFACRKVKKRVHRMTLKKDLKPELCKSPVVPVGEEGCSLM